LGGGPNPKVVSAVVVVVVEVTRTGLPRLSRLLAKVGVVMVLVVVVVVVTPSTTYQEVGVVAVTCPKKGRYNLLARSLQAEVVMT